MGRGIAQACLRAGLAVRIHDADRNIGEGVLCELSKLRRNGHSDMEPVTESAERPRLELAQTPADFADADLVIEAIPEELSLKRAKLTELGAVLRADTILATNTSSLPLSQLTVGLKNPTQICGLHFCHPVAERSLVEVISGPGTSEATAARAEGFARQLGKHPIRVGDAPGFVLNRLLSVYLNESLELLLEGVDVSRLDDAATAFGMPHGPLRQIDEYGLPVALAVGRTMLLAFPDRWIPSELMIAVYKAQRREGRSRLSLLEVSHMAAGAGISWEIDSVVRRIVTERRRAARSLLNHEIEQRLWLPMLLEATRILDEGLIGSSQWIELALSLGLGMTSSYQGLFAWGDAHGAGTLMRWAESLQSLGNRYAPTPLLAQAAARNTSLHSVAGRGQRAA